TTANPSAARFARTVRHPIYPPATGGRRCTRVHLLNSPDQLMHPPGPRFGLTFPGLPPPHGPLPPRPQFLPPPPAPAPPRPPPPPPPPPHPPQTPPPPPAPPPSPPSAPPPQKNPPPPSPPPPPTPNPLPPPRKRSTPSTPASACSFSARR